MLNPTFMIVPSLACQASCKYCFGPHQGKTMGERTAVELYQYATLHDPDSKNRDHAISLTIRYGDTEDVQYLFNHSSDPELKAYLFRILTDHSLSVIDDILKYSKAERSAAEDALCTLMRSYFCDSESGSAEEKLRDCLDRSWLNEYKHKTLRNIFLYKANIGCTKNYQGTTALTFVS